jgi:molecular chaperone GrpE
MLALVLVSILAASVQAFQLLPMRRCSSYTSRIMCEGSNVEGEVMSGAEVDVVESREIIRLENRIEELRKRINETIAARKEVNQEYKVLDAEYGSEIGRVKKEFSRMKERAIEEATDLISSDKANALKEILPMADNYGRAKGLFNPLTTETERNILAAYDSVFSDFARVIEEFGLERVESIGKPFDYQTMEAIMTQPSTEYAKVLITI